MQEAESALIGELRRTMGRLEAALAVIHDALAITNQDGALLWCNDAFVQLTSRPRLQSLGQWIGDLLPPDLEGRPLLGELAPGSSPPSSGSRIVALKQRPLHVIELEWDLVPIEHPAPVVYCLRDISALMSYQELSAQTESIRQRSREMEALNASLQQSHLNLARQIRECPVTGLPNRRGLLEHLDQELATLGRCTHQLAVLFCDLNRFKEINDMHGHQAGDELLIEISSRLQGAIRPSDLVSRLGGDEFVVVSSGLRRAEEAMDIAARLQRAVGQPWRIGDELIHPTLSIGIALTDDPVQGEMGHSEATMNSAELLRRADLAMYAAKAERSPLAHYYEPTIDQRQRQTLLVLQTLRDALAHERLELHFQPIFQLGSGVLRGHEALVRLRGSDGRLIPPDLFIPQAEKGRLISQLGDQVLSRSLQALSASHTPDLTMAVNVSPLQLSEPDYARRVLAACDRHGVDPGWLHVEVTETTLIANAMAVAATLEQLRQAGVRIHLDDFGTGYSSLSLLSDLPVNAVKIDRTFIAALGMSRSKTAVVEALIPLCRNLGLQVIAEGIETQEQLLQLQELGCDDGQGYLLGRPQPFAIRNQPITQDALTAGPAIPDKGSLR